VPARAQRTPIITVRPSSSSEPASRTQSQHARCSLACLLWSQPDCEEIGSDVRQNEVEDVGGERRCDRGSPQAPSHHRGVGQHEDLILTRDSV
jgi:hypothetical protein